MSTVYPRVDVEKTFDEAVRSYGGVVLREKLPPSPNFNNADYVFHFEKIVCELKCLTEDNLYSSNNQLRSDNLISEYYETGRIKSRTINEANWKEWPLELQTKIYEATTRSLRKRIHKADIQIRETKRELRLGGYNGLIVLANNGVSSLPPAAFLHAAQLTLGRAFTEINYFVYLTANLFTAMRGLALPALFWIGFDMQRGPKMDTNFTDRLGRIFKKLVADETGIPSVSEELQDIESFWKARHIKI
jgi:hypothetical protein